MKKFVGKHPGDRIVGYEKINDLESSPYQYPSPVLYIERIDENGVLHREYISSITIIDGDIYYEN